ncbi:MAG: mechanosensitive ion channel domain-containing protein [Solirubrobacterales bacterium]
MPLPKTPPKMFETRSQAWQEVGLLEQVRPAAARRARVEALLMVALFVGVIVLWEHRVSIFGEATLDEIETPLKVIVVVALLALGWAIARDFGRALGPALFRRMEPATAGTVGFLIRLLTVGVALLVALDVAGVNPATLLLGGAFTAVILGLAAQQTLGNVFAGMVLLSAGPFRVGDSVLLQGGQIGGQVDGVVSSLGLLYTTVVTEGGAVMVPNSVVLNVAIVTRRGQVRGQTPASSSEGTRSGSAPAPASAEKR